MGYLQGVSSPKEENFRPDAFKIDMANLTAVCPPGHRSTRTRIDSRGDRSFYFDRDACQQCRFFERCVRSTSEKATRRTLCVNEHYPFVRERRIEQKRAGFKKRMRVRAQVEGTISEATRLHGPRSARYRGQQGHELQFYFTGAAININRIARALTKNRNKTRE